LGYQRYFHVAMLWDKLGALPRPVRHVVAALAQAARYHAGPRKAAEILRCDDDVALFRRVVSVWQEPERLVPGVAPAAGPLDRDGWAGAACARFDRFQLLDALTHLSDDIL